MSASMPPTQRRRRDLRPEVQAARTRQALARRIVAALADRPDGATPRGFGIRRGERLNALAEVLDGLVVTGRLFKRHDRYYLTPDREELP